MAQKPLASASQNRYNSPKLIKDPSLPTTGPTTSKDVENTPKKSCGEKFSKYVYNKEDKTFCNRTCLNWFYILAYSIVYLIFLTTYALIFLFISLWIMRLTTDFHTMDKIDLLTYSENGIGLTATPTSESSYPLIWYRKGQPKDYEKYINALDSLLVRKRRKRDITSLGPCGKSPYGYGESPCVVVRINRQFHWAGKPLVANSTETKIAPVEVGDWMRQDKKLWLYCTGHHVYDKAHVGRIRYYPDPPGFDPGLFPLKTENSPVVAIQISNFSIGVSVAIECKLWYVGGPSTINFMLYVAQDDKVSRSN